MTARSDALLGGSGTGSSRARALLGGGTPSLVVDSEAGGGAFGFLGNVWEEARGIVGGLAGLGSNVVHDTGRAIAQGLPGSQTWGPINDVDASGYHLDDIARALLPDAALPGPGTPGGAIWDDLVTRWGPLLTGDIDEFGHQLFERPLSFGLDALAVGGTAAGGARAVGAAAVRKSPAALGAANEAAEAIRLAGRSGRAATSAGIRRGLDVLGTERPLGGLEALSQRILPQPTLRRMGGDVPSLVAHAPSPNPVTRAMQRPFQRFTTETLEPLRNQVGELQTEIAGRAAAGLPESKALASQLDRLSDTLRTAEDAGLQRIATPAVGELTLWNTTRRTLGELNAHWLRVRTERLRRVQETLRPYYKKDRTFGERAHGRFMNLDVDVQGATRMTWADEVGESRQAVLGGTGRVLTATRTQLDQAERAAAEAANPALVSQVDTIAQQVREHLDNVTDDELAAKGVLRDSEIDAGERYISGLYDTVRRMTQGHADDVDEAKDAMRLVLAEEEVSRLRSGDTLEHMMERRYRPLEMKYGRQVNPDRLEFEGGPSWRELDDSMADAGVSQPLYFPFIDSEKMRFSDFLLNRTRIGGVKAARDPHENLMRGTLLQRGTYLKDPIEAYSRRAARLTRAEETYRFIHGTVQALGRRISDVDEMVPGEMVVAPEGLWRMFRTKTTFEDLVDDLTSAGAQTSPELLDAVKAVFFRNGDEVVERMGITTKGMELYAVPRNVARQMESYAKWSGAFGSKALRLFWDKPQDVWRAFVLSGSPRWLVNNVIGNTVFLKIQGGRLADVIAIAETRFKKRLNEALGTEFDVSMLDRLAEIPGMARVGGGFTMGEGLRSTHMGAAADTATGALYQRLAGAGGQVVRGAKAYGSFIARLNSAAEEVFRQASYLKALERQQILSAVRPVAQKLWSTKGRIDRLLSQKGEITEGQVRASLDEMNRAIGDYGSLGPIERNVIRRFFVPFWSYVRHQGRLLATLPFEHPGKAELLGRIAEANAEFMEQYGPVPEWLVGAAPLGPPGPQVSFMTQRGAEPFAGSFDSPVSMLSVPIKLALERAQGRNSFTGERFTDPNIIRPYGSDQAFRIIRDEAGNVIDAVPLEGAGSLPGIGEHLLSQLPHYELAEQALAGGRVYDTSFLIDPREGQGAVIDPDTGEPRFPTSFADQAGRLAGFPAYDYDLQRYQERLEELRQAAITAAQNGA